MRRGEASLAERVARAGGWGVRTVTPLPECVSEREELANSITGGFGLLGSLVALGVLIDLGRPTGNLGVQLSAVAYGLTLVLSYAATTVYHAARCRVRKARWRILDHCAVYALIAGSYTPLAVVGIGGRLGTFVLVSAWGLALLGVAFKLRFRFRYPGTSVAVYLVMGWLGIFMIGEILEAVGSSAVLLMAAGGAAFTIGTIFFGAKRLPYNHAVWHVMVMAGTLLHYKAIVDHVLVAAA